MAEIQVEVDLTQLVDGYIGNPEIAVAVPVYDKNEDKIKNYVGWWNPDPAQPTPKVLTIGVPFPGRSRMVNIDNWVTQFSSRDYIEPQWNLLYVIRSVYEEAGYEVDLSDFEGDPYKKIFLATPSGMMKNALPHWTLREFSDQIALFLGAYVMIDTKIKRISFIAANEFERPTVSIEVEDDFSMEIDEEATAKSRMSSNLVYVRQEDDSNVYENLPEDSIKEMPKKEFTSYDLMVAAYNLATEDDKKRYLWKCPEGYYTQWERNGVKKMMHVNVFGALVKNENSDNDIEVKITPVPISDDVGYPIIETTRITGQSTTIIDGQVVIVNNYEYDLKGPCYAKLPCVEIGATGASVDYGFIQDILEGSAEEADASSTKPDRMDVMLVDNYLNFVRESPWGERGEFEYLHQLPMGYTSADYRCEPDIWHEPLSLSMNPVHGLTSLSGKQEPRTINPKQKYQIKFLSDVIPNAESIFVFNNKRYIAEKIEVDIKDDVDKLMTGYFYELI